MTAFPPPDPDRLVPQGTPVAVPAPRCGLTRAARWILGIGWVVLAVAAGTVLRAAEVVGDPPRGADWRVLTALLPAAALVALALDRRGVLVLSALGGAQLVGLGIVDLVDGRTNLAVLGGALGVSGLLLTLAGAGGRVDRSGTARPA
jgi:hypothetical protein